MPVHDWSKVGTWLFHDFHTGWLIYLRDALNRGILPDGYHAYAEQRAELYSPDVLALTSRPKSPSAESHTVALAEPRAERRVVVQSKPIPGRLLSIRHTSDQRIVSVIEIVSRRNKDRMASVLEFADKVTGLIRSGIHVAVIDILPPGRHDPQGLHPVICDLLAEDQPADAPPEGRPLTLASYRADDATIAYLNYVKIGLALPEMPLFLNDGIFVNLPLESTYLTEYDGLPSMIRAELG